jgi:hypothetical protein
MMAFSLSPAAGQSKCNSTRECAQVAVENARSAEAAAKTAMDQIKQLKIQCETQKTNATGHYPEVTATIPKEKQSLYVLTGGSCSMNYHPQLPHNGTMLESRPASDRSGWFCKAGDPPNIPLTITVTAEVIFCRIGS